MGDKHIAELTPLEREQRIIELQESKKRREEAKIELEPKVARFEELAGKKGVDMSESDLDELNKLYNFLIHGKRVTGEQAEHLKRLYSDS